jgi:hypothetical protein
MHDGTRFRWPDDLPIEDGRHILAAKGIKLASQQGIENLDAKKGQKQ